MFSKAMSSTSMSRSSADKRRVLSYLPYNTEVCVIFVQELDMDIMNIFHSQCRYKGHVLENMEIYVTGCKVCTCNSGSIACRPKSCPPFKCTHPRMGSCCRHCDGLFICIHTDVQTCIHTCTKCFIARLLSKRY